MPALDRAKALREERGTLAKQAADILAAAKKDNRELTPEEGASVDKIHADIRTKGDEAKAIEAAEDRAAQQAEIEAELRKVEPVLAGKPNTRPDADAKVSRSEAVRSWMLGGTEFLSAEERSVLNFGNMDRAEVRQMVRANPDLAQFAINPNALRFRLSPLPSHPDQRRSWNRDRMRYEYRGTNPQSTTTTAGGYTVPDAPMAGIEDALLAFGGMRAARTTILRTETGADLPIPTQDDTTSKGAILAENTQTTTVTQLTFGQVVLGAYKYTSQIIKASYEFLQDTSLDAEGFIARHLGERIGRITNDHFTFGTNSSQPNGLAWASTIGKTSASATALAYADLVDLKHSVDPSYRANAEWMFNDSTMAAISKIASTTGEPLWRPGIALRVPDTILGDPYIINQSMESVAADNHPVMYGDFSKYYIRDVMDIMVLRLVERGADYAQIWFIAFSRHDGDLVDAGTNPIKHLRTPAS